MIEDDSVLYCLLVRVFIEFILSFFKTMRASLIVVFCPPLMPVILQDTGVLFTLVHVVTHKYGTARQSIIRAEEEAT